MLDSAVLASVSILNRTSFRLCVSAATSSIQQKAKDSKNTYSTRKDGFKLQDRLFFWMENLFYHTLYSSLRVSLMNMFYQEGLDLGQRRETSLLVVVCADGLLSLSPLATTHRILCIGVRLCTQWMPSGFQRWLLFLVDFMGYCIIVGDHSLSTP